MCVVPGSGGQAPEVRAIGANRKDIVRAINGSRELNDIAGRRPGGKIVRFHREGTDRTVRHTQDTQTLFLLTQNAVDDLLAVLREAGESAVGGPVGEVPPLRPIRAHHHDSSRPGPALKENAESKRNPMPVR